MAKITKAEMPALAEQIVKCLGGKENVARINHCATRLRVNPVDMEKVDKDGLKRLHGVIGIDSSKAELWGDRIFEKCGIGRDERGDGGKTLEIRGKRRLSARDGGANYQQS